MAFSVADYLLHHQKPAGTPSVGYQRVSRGAYIYRPADPAPFIYLIRKGVVKVGSFGALGERVLYDVLQPDETFGNLHYLDGDGVEFAEFAQAATSLDLLRIDFTYFRHMVVHDPVVAEWFNRVIVRRWCKAETRLLHRSQDVETRLVSLRNEYSTPVADADAKRHDMFRLLSHQEIADLIGTTRQTVSRKLKRLPT